MLMLCKLYKDFIYSEWHKYDLLQSLQNQSSDIRLVTERVLWWVWKDADTPVLEPSLIKPIIKALLDNTKDKNTSVRAQSEHTIVNLLRLRQGDSVMQVHSKLNKKYSFITLIFNSYFKFNNKLYANYTNAKSSCITCILSRQDHRTF